jgi:hypothetical protein
VPLSAVGVPIPVSGFGKPASLPASTAPPELDELLDDVLEPEELVLDPELLELELVLEVEPFPSGASVPQ